MIKCFAIYEVNSGKILQIGSCAENMLEDQTPSDPSRNLIEIPVRLHTFYVDISTTPHEVKEKSEHQVSASKTEILADDTDIITITGLHNPSTVTWPDGIITEETTGSMSFTLDLAGNYTVEIDAIPYLKEVIHVTATDPA